MVLAFLLREALTSAVGPDFPEYVLFYPTVMIVALLAGLWPGLLAMLTASIMIFAFWLIPGREPLFHIGTSNFVGLALFMVVCGFLTGVAELYRRSRQKAAAYDKERRSCAARTTTWRRRSSSGQRTSRRRTGHCSW